MDWSLLPKSAKEAKALGVTWYYNGSECQFGHKVPRSTSNSECLICRRFRGFAAREKLKIAEWVAQNKDKAEENEKQFHASVDDGVRRVLRDANLLKEEKPEASPPQEESKPPAPDQGEEKTLTGADHRYTSRAWVAAFIARQKPLHFTIREAFNWITKEQRAPATYSGVSQAINKYANEHSVITPIAAFGKARQYKCLPKFFLLHEKEIAQFREMVPADAEAIRDNALTAFKAIREETVNDNDDGLFDHIDGIIGEMEDETDKIKKDFALELNGDETSVDEDLLDNTADLALIGRSILHYIIELQSGTATEETLRKMDNLKIDNTSLKVRVNSLEGQLRRLKSMIDENNNTIKDKEHTIYQLRQRLEKIRMGIDDSKTPTSKVPLSEVARISRAVKNPTKVIRRRNGAKTPPNDNKNET